MGNIEAAAKALFETWGGKWEAAPEFRKEQAREEAKKIIEAYLGSHDEYDIRQSGDNSWR